MVESKLKSNIIIGISVLSLLIAIIIMLFGDNIVGKFGAPELVLISTKDDFKLPDKLNEIIVNNIDEQESSLIPNTIRIVTIKNNGGSPSKNLNIVIEMDGPIYQYKLTSTETVESQKKEYNKLLVNFSRLSKNAEVSMIFWIRDERNTFNASYADDNNSGFIQSVEGYGKGSGTFSSIMLLISVASIATILYETLKKYIFFIRKENQVSSAELIDNISNIYDKTQRDYDDHQKSNTPIANEEVKQKLNEIIRISQDLT